MVSSDDRRRNGAAAVSLWNWLSKLLRGPSPRRDQSKPIDPSATVDLPESPSRVTSGTPTTLLVGVISTVGNHREHNEDNYFIPGLGSLPAQESARPVSPRAGFETTIDDLPKLGDKAGSTVYPVQMNHIPQPVDPPPLGNTGLFMVADGMGGQLGGEVASKMAVDLIPRELVNRLNNSDREDSSIKVALREAVAAANREVLAISHVNTEVSNLGTTVVLLFFREDRVFVANFGDSRAYRLRGDRIELLTEDHTLAKALIKVGTIAPEEEERHRFRNVLYLYLGCNEAREGPEVQQLEVRSGDRFLLCSDGLTGVVRDDNLAEVLRHENHPQHAAERLVNLALANLSKDNVTAVVIHAV